MAPRGIPPERKVSPSPNGLSPKVKRRNVTRASFAMDGLPSREGRSLMEFSFFSHGNEGEHAVTDERDGRLWRQLCTDTPHTKQGQRAQLFRMLMVPFLPILGIAIYSTINLSDAVQRESQLFSVQRDIKVAHDLAEVVHMLEMERALSVYFLARPTDNTRKVLINQFSDTDRSISQLTEWPKLSQEKYDTGRYMPYANIDMFYAWLQQERNKVTGSMDTIYNAIVFYNEANEYFLDAVRSQIKLVPIRGVRKLMIAMTNYARGKEDFGVILTMVMEFVLKDELTPPEMVIFLAAEALGDDHLLTARAYSPESHEYYKELLRSYPDVEPFVAQARNATREGDKSSCDGCAPQQVLKMLMTYMDILKLVSDKLESWVLDAIDSDMRKANIKVVYSAIILVLEVVLSTILVNMIRRMTSSVQNFANDAYRKGQEIKVAKKRTDLLLAELLPPSVASALKEGKTVEPETYDNVSIYFSDIVGFTNLSSKSTPFQVVTLLSLLYGCFDEILSQYDVYKVETIGDAYMVSSGVPRRNGLKHANNIADIALELLNAIYEFEIPEFPDERLRIRIGLHAGMVAAGVVGSKMPRYCLFGDTVYQGSGMEAKSLPMKIHVSLEFKAGLDAVGGYLTEERTDRPNIGPGSSPTFWLLAKYDKNSETGYSLQDPALLQEQDN